MLTQIQKSCLKRVALAGSFRCTGALRSRCAELARMGLMSFSIGKGFRLTKAGREMVESIVAAEYYRTG